jgi:hypothetical protein
MSGGKADGPVLADRFMSEDRRRTGALDPKRQAANGRYPAAQVCNHFDVKCLLD